MLKESLHSRLLVGRDPVEYVDSWGTVLQNAIEIEAQHKDEYYRQKLTELQYVVTRQGGTERPYTGIYDKEKREGHLQVYLL